MPANRGILEYYQTQCGEILNNCHIFKCHKLNQHGTEYDTDKIHNGLTIKMKQYLKIWKENITKLNEITSGTSRDTAVPVIVTITWEINIYRTSLLCIMGELAGGGSVAVAFGASYR